MVSSDKTWNHVQLGKYHINSKDSKVYNFRCWILVKSFISLVYYAKWGAYLLFFPYVYLLNKD